MTYWMTFVCDALGRYYLFYYIGGVFENGIETAVSHSSLETHLSRPMSIRKEDLDLENPFNNFKYVSSA